ncbi:AraC family transcriptional regulator [Pseudomonadota bacterium]
MDVISDVLRNIRFSGNVFLNTNFSGTWGARFQPIDMSVFHCVLFGSCWIGIEHQDENVELVELKAGDVAFLPRGRTHFIANAPETECMPMEIMPGTPCMHTDIPDNDADVRVLCGVFQPIDDFQHPLFLTLPEFIHARFSEHKKGTSWASHAAYAIDTAIEQESPGVDALVDRLYEILFIQLLQNFYSKNDAVVSYFNSRNAPRIYSVLEAIHKDPATNWTVDSLAELAHLSRSAFTTNFREAIGMSPMAYVNAWRMYKARALVRSSGVSIRSIAHQVGFRTQTGFNKAFKQFFGVSAKQTRKELID